MMGGLWQATSTVLQVICSICHHFGGKTGFNTVNPSLHREGLSRALPDDEQNGHTPPKLGNYWEVSGNLLGIGDGFPNTSLVLMETLLTLS